MDAYALDAQGKMNKSIESYRLSLSTLRTGRASPALLNGIEVDYYGSPTPLNQIASISVPEPRQLLINPYDKNDVKNIVAAILLFPSQKLWFFVTKYSRLAAFSCRDG